MNLKMDTDNDRGNEAETNPNIINTLYTRH